MKKTNRHRSTKHYLGGIGTLIIFFILFAIIRFKPAAAATPEPTQPPASGEIAEGTTIYVEPAGQTSWDELVAYQAANPEETQHNQTIIPFNAMPADLNLSLPENQSLPSLAEPLAAQPAAPAAVQAAGNLAANFQALPDNGVTIPPDTMGAAGPNHLMTMINSQVRIQNKNGGVISTVSLWTFWNTNTGLSGHPFDPHLVYDSLTSRWIAVVDANGKSANSEMWFAISANNDPTGTWTYYKFTADSSNPKKYWADYPGLGVNKDYIAITNNMFTISSPYTSGGPKMWVIDKSTLPPNPGPVSVKVYPRQFTNGFTLQPAVTFDSAESNLYIVDNGWYSGSTKKHRVSRIQKTPTGAQWSLVGYYNLTHNYGYNADAIQPSTNKRIKTNDNRLINAVVRNGHLWTAHTGGLPAGGGANRTAIFWYEANPVTPSLIQSGVIDGGSGIFYMFPSINVNKHNDVVIGFSHSDNTHYAEAVFSSRQSGDTAGWMSAPQVIKQGLDVYVKDFNHGRIRWGDYSATAVDPADDTTFWTIQEYAAKDVGVGQQNDRWGTWWGKVSFNHGTADLSVTKSAAGNQSRTFVYTIVAGNAGPQTGTGVAVVDNLPPAQVNYVSNDCGASAPVNGLWTWNIGNLNKNASPTCHLTVTLTNSATGWVPNTVHISGNQNDNNHWNNQQTYAFSIPAGFSDEYSCIKNGQINEPIPGVLLNDVDLDSDTMTAILKDNVSHGTLTFNANGSFIYTPTTDYQGFDSFTYYAYDGKVTSHATTVTLAVGDVPITFKVYIPFVKR